MDNEIITFNKEGFGEIRGLAINGEPWFVGKDIAERLGYTNSKDALSKHIDLEDKRLIQRSQNTTLDIPNRGLTIINESGLYSLILSSKLPRAKEFKHWVTSEVLPSIRKTGTYHQPKGKELLALALVEANTMLTTLEKENQNLKMDIAHKTEEIVDLKPKAIFADRVTACKGDISIWDLADLVTRNGKAIGRNAMFDWLRDNGYFFKNGRKAKQKYVKDGLFVLDIRPTTNGAKFISSTRVTGKGVKQILEKFFPGRNDLVYELQNY